AMHNDAHAPHRLSGPPTLMGNPYPVDNVVAVIDDQAEAVQAVTSLRDAGLAEDDVIVLDKAAVAQANHPGRMQRVGAWLSEAFSDDAAYARLYAHEAERGHYLVIAHAPRLAAVERVRKALRAHGAHDMRHFERLTVTDLW